MPFLEPYPYGKNIAKPIACEMAHISFLARFHVDYGI